jgi:signal transduction histidine kinase/DNA-binding response OmpR family regulator
MVKSTHDSRLNTSEQGRSIDIQDSESPIDLLIVEDNQGDIIIFREMLKASGLGFYLTSTTTLRSSIELVRSKKFDLVFLDLGLPDSSGIQTLKDFLSFESRVPVIVTTGLDDEESALTSLREGAQDYLVKNRLDPENITRSIKYSIERKRIENLRRKNSYRLTVLSETTRALHEGDDVMPIYTLICNSIRQLIYNEYVISVEVGKNEPLSFKISNTEQFGSDTAAITKLLGFDIFSPALPLDENQLLLIKECGDGVLHHIKGGISELLGSSSYHENGRELEKMLGINYTYLVGFQKNDTFFGGIILLLENDLEEDDRKIIENICAQASLTIYRRVIQKNLVISEAKYQKLAEELEIKVAERTHELEKANSQLRISEARLKELNATKDKFFNIVAHDLKNPFTSLLGATEVLIQNIENMDREKIRKLAQILNDSSKSGYAILLNLLDWSRSQTGLIKINPQFLNLRKILLDNITDLHLSSLDKQINVIADIGEDIQIVVDKNMLNSILRNLLSNAIKFTPRGGKVHISCHKNEGDITIRVKDNGIGIPAESIEKIFRIDSKYSRPGTEKELGTGLGLKLCREFVERLGGKIWVESTENVGSEFCFTIPLKD